MIYKITWIIKRLKFIYWQIQFTFPDRRIRSVEMRQERTDKKYLKYCHKTKCRARISILIKNPIYKKKAVVINFNETDCIFPYAKIENVG